MFIRKCLFSFRAINYRHILFTDCVNASSVNMVENKIVRYVIRDENLLDSQ